MFVFAFAFAGMEAGLVLNEGAQARAVGLETRRLGGSKARTRAWRRRNGVSTRRDCVRDSSRGADEEGDVSCQDRGTRVATACVPTLVRGVLEGSGVGVRMTRVGWVSPPSRSTGALGGEQLERRCSWTGMGSEAGEGSGPYTAVSRRGSHFALRSLSPLHGGIRWSIGSLWRDVCAVSSCPSASKGSVVLRLLTAGCIRCAIVLFVRLRQ